MRLFLTTAASSSPGIKTCSIGCVRAEIDSRPNVPTSQKPERSDAGASMDLGSVPRVADGSNSVTRAQGLAAPSLGSPGRCTIVP
jgi:hypothetical protein